MMSINQLVTFLILSAIGNNCCASTGEDLLTPAKSNAVQSSRMKESALEELNAEGLSSIWVWKTPFQRRS